MKDLSKEKRIYLACWRKALRTNQSVILKMPTMNAAITTRMNMYRTIRPFRTNDGIDSELTEAAEKFVIALQKKPPAIIILPRVSRELAEGMLEDLGLTEEDLMLEDEQQSLDHIMKAQESPTIPTENPFFKRD